MTKDYGRAGGRASGNVSARRILEEHGRARAIAVRARIKADALKARCEAVNRQVDESGTRMRSRRSTGDRGDLLAEYATASAEADVAERVADAAKRRAERMTEHAGYPLTSGERAVLRLAYVRLLSWSIVAETAGISRMTAYRWRESAFEKIDKARYLRD